jgi:hypothetical protein
MVEERLSLLFYRTCLLGIVLGLTATLYFLSGVIGYIGHPVPNVLTATVLAATPIYFFYLYFVGLFEKSRLGFFIWLCIGLVIIAEILLGLVPPTARDELTHHLAIPKLYAKAGRILEIPFDYPSYYPMLLDMLFIPWVAWGWDSVPKLIHGLFGFLTGLLLYGYLGRRLSPFYGLLGFFLFVSTPAILRLGNWAYVDLGLVFYATASLLGILKWIEGRQIGKPDSRWIVIAGLSAGFAAATKPNGLVVLLILFISLAWGLGRNKAGIRETVFQLAGFVLLAVIPLAPWLAKNFAWTGNPFFPFFSSFFQSISGGGGGDGGGMGVFTKRELLYGESVWKIVALPLRLFFSGQDDRAQYFDGVLNPMLIVFLPWAFTGKWLEEKKVIFGFAALQLFLGLFMVDLRVRYILPLVPALVILLVYGFYNLRQTIARPVYLVAALVFLNSLNVIYFWDYVQRVSPLRFLTGQESRSEYLRGTMPDYRMIEYANQNLPGTARIYLLFMGRRGYYSERDYLHDGGEDPWLLLGLIRSAKDGGDLENGFRQRGLTHIFAREDLLKHYLENNLTVENFKVWNAFVSGHVREFYRDGRYAIYEIHG